MEIKEFIEKVAEAIEIENVEEILPTTKFRDLDEWSSISVMILIALFDEEFDKQIGDKEIREAITIQDLYNLATA